MYCSATATSNSIAAYAAKNSHSNNISIVHTLFCVFSVKQLFGTVRDDTCSAAATSNSAKRGKKKPSQYCKHFADIKNIVCESNCTYCHKYKTNLKQQHQETHRNYHTTMDHNPEDECLVGLERALMVKSMTLKGYVYACTIGCWWYDMLWYDMIAEDGIRFEILDSRPLFWY